MCSRYLSSRAVTRQVLWAYMSLTSVFGMGSDGSAACGGCSDLSEWQGSTRDDGAPSPRTFVGDPNRKQVDPPSVPQKRKPHNQSCEVLCSRYLSSRAVTRQVLWAYISLTSVFGMGSDGSAACGGCSDLSEWQGSTRDDGAPSPRTFVGDPNRKQLDPPSVPQKRKPHNQSCEVLCSRYLSSRAVTRQVLWAYRSLTSVFGMGTGGPS